MDPIHQRQHEPTAVGTKDTNSTKNTKNAHWFVLRSFFVALVFFVPVVARRRPVPRWVAVAA